MMFTLGCLIVLFGVLAILWADGRLARGFLHSLLAIEVPAETVRKSDSAARGERLRLPGPEARCR